MESLSTRLDLLTADLLIALLPSFVTMATLSLEAAAPGLVRVMECGVGQLQHVSVSAWNGLCTVCLLSVSSPIQLTAVTYPHWPMGWLCTVMDPLATDLSSLVLYTPATLATLSLEVPLAGPVWVEGAGLDHLQLVKVSYVTLVQFVFVSIYTRKPN